MPLRGHGSAFRQPPTMRPISSMRARRMFVAAQIEILQLGREAEQEAQLLQPEIGGAQARLARRACRSPRSGAPARRARSHWMRSPSRNFWLRGNFSTSGSATAESGTSPRARDRCGARHCRLGSSEIPLPRCSPFAGPQEVKRQRCKRSSVLARRKPRIVVPVVRARPCCGPRSGRLRAAVPGATARHAPATVAGFPAFRHPARPCSCRSSNPASIPRRCRSCRRARSRWDRNCPTGAVWT